MNVLRILALALNLSLVFTPEPRWMVVINAVLAGYVLCIVVSVAIDGEQR